jgi:hypothetical protein
MNLSQSDNIILCPAGIILAGPFFMRLFRSRGENIFAAEGRSPRFALLPINTDKNFLPRMNANWHESFFVSPYRNLGDSPPKLSSYLTEVAALPARGRRSTQPRSALYPYRVRCTTLTVRAARALPCALDNPYRLSQSPGLNRNIADAYRYCWQYP